MTERRQPVLAAVTKNGSPSLAKAWVELSCPTPAGRCCGRRIRPRRERGSRAAGPPPPSAARPAAPRSSLRSLPIAGPRRRTPPRCRCLGRRHRRPRRSARCGSRCSPRRSRPRSAWCSGCRWPGCSRGSASRGGAGAGPGHGAAGAAAGGRPASRCSPRFGRTGVVGESAARRVRHHDPVHHVAVVIAHTFVALPFFVISVEGALRARRPRYETAAATLGADAVDHVPAGHPAAGRPRAWPPARCSRGPGRWASSAPRSRSPATTPAPRRRCRCAVYTPCSRPRHGGRAELVLLVVCVLVLAALRERWLGGCPGPGRDERPHADVRVAGPVTRSRSTWPPRRARSSRWSAPTAPARPRCCGLWPARSPTDGTVRVGDTDWSGLPPSSAA